MRGAQLRFAPAFRPVSLPRTGAAPATVGTDKYPDENEYSRFLAAHSGWSNAYTDRERTVYFFEVGSDSLPPALDMFAEFFKTPKFTASATSRELDAVDAEHAKNIQADHWREYQLDKTTSDPAHPFHKFATGDSVTLRDTPAEQGIDVRDELLKFHDKYYSANIMSLVLVGKESLGELEELAVSLFSAVPNKDTPVPQPTAPAPALPWRIGVDTRLVQYMVPVAEKRTLTLSWQLPCIHDTYASKPERYYANLLGHEGPGSLLSHLKAKGWAAGLSAGARFADLTFTQFNVKVSLTPAGVDAVDDIVQAVFAYIQLLREEGPQVELWQEQAAIEVAYVKFMAKASAGGTAQHLAVAQQAPGIPTHRMLLAGQLFYEWDAAAMESFLQHFTLDNLRVRVVAKEVQDKCDQSERWYKTQFGSVPFSAEQEAKWTGVPRPEPSAMRLPDTNQFIATDFSLANGKAARPTPEEGAAALAAATASAASREGLWAHPAMAKAAALAVDAGRSGMGLRPIVPVLLVNSPAMRLSWHGDGWFGEPKIRLDAMLHLPAAYASPRSSVLTEMFCRMLKESLNEYAYAAELADLSYSCSATHGINLALYGFSHKLPVLLDKVLGRMASLGTAPAPHAGFTDEQFAVQLDAFKRSLESRASQDAVRHAMYESGQVEVAPTWHVSAKLEAIAAGVEPGELRAFVAPLLSSLALEVHVHGNADAETAQALGQQMLDAFPAATPPLPRQIVEHRTLVMPWGAEVRYCHQHPSPNEPNSAVRLSLQLGPDDGPTRAIGELLAQLLREPAFDVLRTRESLGYIVHVGVTREGGAVTLMVVVQSNKVPARVLEGRMEAFLAAHTAHLEATLTPDAFAQQVSSLLKDKLQARESLRSEAAFVWTELRRSAAFGRMGDMAAYLLDKGSPEGVVRVLRRAVVRGGDLRRKVAVLVFGGDGAAAGGGGDAVSDSRAHVGEVTDGGEGGTPIAAPPAVTEQVSGIADGGLALLAGVGPAPPSIAAVFEGSAAEPLPPAPALPVLELHGREEAALFAATAPVCGNTRQVGVAAWAAAAQG